MPPGWIPIAQVDELGEFPVFPFWLFIMIPVFLVIAALTAWFIYRWYTDKRTDERGYEFMREEGLLSPRASGSACPNCGAKVTAGSSHCQVCGSTLSPVGEETAAGRYGVMRRQVMVGESVAFQDRELVQVESVSPDASRPEYKYVVFSKNLNQRFRLSDRDLKLW